MAEDKIESIQELPTVEPTELTESIVKENSGFSQQVYEATESAVGEGPQNQDDSNDYEPTFSGGEGNMLMDETPPQDVTLSHEDSESSLPEIIQPCETQNKINGSLMTQRFRRLMRDPNTWRIIKGLVVLAIAVKLINSLESFDQYLPGVFGNQGNQ